MKSKINKTIVASLAFLLLLSSCTSKTAVDSVSTTETTVSATTDTNQISSDIEAVASEAVSSLSDESTAETTTFDIHDYTFENIYGSQLINYLNHQYYFDGEAVPVYETNYYFVNTFLDLSEYANYGYYPMTSEGFIDLAAEVPVSDEAAEKKFETYGDFYRSYTETMIYSNYIVLKNAKEQGLELDEETVNKIDELLDSVKTNNAEPNNMSLDEYLELYYGPNCTAEHFKEVLNNYYLNNVFTDNYVKNYEFAEDEKVYIPQVRYALFWAPAAESEEADLTNAKKQADAMLASCQGNIDTFATIGQAAYDNQEIKEYGEITPKQGSTVPAFDSWCYDTGRQPGDMEVICSEEYGYFIVGFVGMAEDQQAMEQIAVENMGKQINTNIESDVYNFHTDDEFLPPPVVESNPIYTGEDETNGSEIPAPTVSESGETETVASETTASESGMIVSDVPEKNNTMNVMIAVLVAAVVILIVVIIVLLTKSKKDTSDALEESLDKENEEITTESEEINED